jgi:hypothetical protein
LGDAITYGIDEATLFAAVKKWAKEYKHVLCDFVEEPNEPKSNGAKPNGPKKYLRVVNRVYLVKSVDVGMTRESATGGGATAGSGSALPAIDLPTLNKTLSDTLSDPKTAGGSVRFTFASSNSVAMKQTFPRALVVGYIGYDVPILPGGELGTYSSTLQNLTGKTR